MDASMRNRCVNSKDKSASGVRTTGGETESRTRKCSVKMLSINRSLHSQCQTRVKTNTDENSQQEAAEIVRRARTSAFQRWEYSDSSWTGQNTTIVCHGYPVPGSKECSLRPFWIKRCLSRNGWISQLLLKQKCQRRSYYWHQREDLELHQESQENETITKHYVDQEIPEDQRSLSYSFW